MAITFKKFQQLGRIGNQFYQYAFMLSLAQRHGVKLRLPRWKYAPYFDATFPEGSVNASLKIEESKVGGFHYTPDAYDSLDYSQDINFEGYFQSYRYFSEDLVRKHLTFKPEFVQQVRQPYEHVFEKPTIAIHARKGDYVGNDYYEQLPVLYYIKALFEHFPNWRDYNLLFFSDGIEWLKLHFGCLENAYFVEGQKDIADLCLMSQCSNFIIANSSFSWWAAYLSESPEKIVRPAHHFDRGKEENDIKDFYPEHWEVCDHKDGWKIDLSDLTLTIPVHRDHRDREENLALNLQFLNQYFNTNIIVGEQGGRTFEGIEGIEYMNFDFPYFHRTRMLNLMAEAAQTPIIANWDADIIIAPLQVFEAVERIRSGADVVYPYSGQFARMRRKEWFFRLQSSLDIGIAAKTHFPPLRKHDPHSTGGAIFSNRESFFEGGGENEHLISFAPDDAERFERFTKLGFRVERVPGALYHMEHFCGINSGTKHKFIDANRAEWHKVAAMSREELQVYVESWEWVKAMVN